MSSRILMVDDEAPTRELYSLYFQTRGIQVETASSPAEALQKLAAEPFDLVLLDLRLGNSDGLDLIKPIKAVRPQVPVLAFTGKAFDDATRRRAAELGACGVVGKAEPLDYLVRMIQKNITLSGQ